jgi:hypothetical protein
MHRSGLLREGGLLIRIEVTLLELMNCLVLGQAVRMGQKKASLLLGGHFRSFKSMALL